MGAQKAAEQIANARKLHCPVQLYASVLDHASMNSQTQILIFYYIILLIIRIDFKILSLTLQIAAKIGIWDILMHFLEL